MKLGLLLPSILATARFSDRIFAQKPLFIAFVDALVAKGHEVFCYSAEGLATKATVVSGDALLSARDYPSVKVKRTGQDTHELAYRATQREYELELTSRAFVHARENRMELMHCYDTFFSHYISRLVPDLPVIYTLHDPPYDELTLEGWRIRHFKSDRYVAISDHQKHLYEGLGVSVTGVVHHGLPVDSFPFEGTPEQYLTFIGRLIPEKGPIDAIDAAMKTNTKLAIATSENYMITPYAQKEIMPRLSSTNLVSIKGLLKEKDRDTWLAKAKALLFPIRWEEPFGLVMVEAMACGTPVIAYHRGSVSEIVRDGVTGFIVDPDDIDRPGKGSWVIKKQGVDGIIEAINRIGEIDRSACRRHVEENFSVKKMVEEYEKVYRKVMERTTL